MTSFGVVATVFRSGAGSERAPVRGVQVREKLKCLRVCVCICGVGEGGGKLVVVEQCLVS